MIDIKLDPYCTAAHLETNTILLSKYRLGKLVVDFLVEENVENNIEHETIHLLFNTLINKVTSWLFDIIEYQTNTIFYHEIPEHFEYKNKNNLTARVLKDESFKRVYSSFLPAHLLILGEYRASLKKSKSSLEGN